MNYRAKEILSFILLITGIIVSVLEIIGVIDLNFSVGSGSAWGI